MKNLKPGQEIIAIKPIRVNFSNSSSSGHVELPAGTVLVVLKKNDKSYQVLYRYDWPIWMEDDNGFTIPGFRKDRLLFDDLDKIKELPEKWAELIELKGLY